MNKPKRGRGRKNANSADEEDKYDEEKEGNSDAQQEAAYKGESNKNKDSKVLLTPARSLYAFEALAPETRPARSSHEKTGKIQSGVHGLASTETSIQNNHDFFSANIARVAKRTEGLRLVVIMEMDR
jgi:hypothetical protein